MIVSPLSRNGSRSLMLESTTPAGTISQTARGFARLLTNAASDADPTAPACVRSLTAAADLSKTAHLWPPLRSRRTMFAPIRPSPIIPISMFSTPYIKVRSGAGFGFSVSTYQGIRRTVMSELRSRLALQFGNDVLSQRLAQLHSPLIERIDVPDRALGEDDMLVQGHDLP